MIIDKAAPVQIDANTQVQTSIQTTSVAADKSSRLHLDYLDGLRALAALTVIADHAYCILYWKEGGLIPKGGAFALGYLQMLGHFAVTTFIVLSGFCLMLPVVNGSGKLKGGARTFFRKRARRILPPYYFALLLSLILIGTVLGQPTHSHWDTSIHVDRTGLLTHLLLIHNMFPTAFYQINNALWTVAVEWQIYFLFPLIVLAWARYGGMRATLSALACGYGLYLVVRHTSLSGLNTPYLGLFALGALGAGITFHPAPYYQRLRQRLPAGALSALLFGIVVAASLYATWPKAIGRYVFLDFLIGASAVLLLIAAGRSPSNPARAALSWKPLVFLGTFSYSIYLIHVPVQQFFWQFALRPLHLPPMPAFFLLALLGTPFILGGAYLFFLVCERPFMNHVPKAV